MSSPIRALIVEDSEHDALWIARQLRAGGFNLIFERVETMAQMSAGLELNPWDLIISDYSMPRFTGSAALKLYQEHGLDIPFIVVSGHLGEDLAVEMMRAGAHDYIMKSNVARLVPAIRRELQSTQERRKRRQAEAAKTHLASIVESCEDAIIGRTLNGVVISWNAAAERLYGYSAEEMIGGSISALVPEHRPGDLVEIDAKLKSRERVEGFETVRVRKDGREIEVSLTVSPIRDSTGQIIGASAVARDITQLKTAERERLRLIEDLRHALADVRALSGLLPICSGCKKIRDDHGYWQQVESYISEHSTAEFTHGICPECSSRLYPVRGLEAGGSEQRAVG